MPTPLLSDDDRRALLRQYGEAYDRCQQDYDSSVRTLAAGGVAVSASLITAFHQVSTAGTAALSAFGLSLAANVVAYVVAQQDLKARMLRVREGQFVEATTFTTWTAALNYLAGGSLVIGAALLGLFVATSAS